MPNDDASDQHLSRESLTPVPEVYPFGRVLPPPMTGVPMAERKCYGDDNYGNVCGVRLHCKHFTMLINPTLPGYMQMMMPAANYTVTTGCSEYWDENLKDHGKKEAIQAAITEAGGDATKKKSIFDVLGVKK